jgi:phenylacetate-CoA ligase
MKLHQIADESDFISLEKGAAERIIVGTTSDQWETMGAQNALNVFNDSVEQVPAYGKFVESNNILPASISSIRQFEKIPYTDKKNYIDQFPLEELVWAGDLSKSYVINSSSGTTGMPYYWPGSNYQVIQGSLIKEYIYRNSFELHKNKTLLIICFGMGTWIAGSFTFLTSHLIAKKGYPLTIITPGFNKEETLRILKLVSPKYDQTVIAGIPTFVKDLLEDWRRLEDGKKTIKIKFLFAAEGFSETWRDYVLDMVGSTSVLTDAVSILGSADAALMAFETPFSILIRKLASVNKALCKALFNNERVPSIQNYLPTHRFFESSNGELLITSRSSLPLIRYNIHDEGGILKADYVKHTLLEFGYDIKKEFSTFGLEYELSNLPFVYIFGRGKFVATIYAANIYPENIREVLVHEHLREHITGQFTIETKFDDNQDHFLHLNIELAENVVPNEELEGKIVEIFVQTVKELNSEYNRVCQEYGIKAKPKVNLHNYGHSELFPKDRIKKNS